MAVILSSTKSTTGSPYVYYEVSAEEVAGTRTANSVQIKWGARARLANADSSLGTGSGYGIIGHLKIGGVEKSSITLKGTSTKWTGNSWHNYVYDTITITGLSATQTAIGSITFNATRTSGSSSSAGYMTDKTCSDVTITKGAAPSVFDSGYSTGTLGTPQTIKIKSVSDSFTHTLTFKTANHSTEYIFMGKTTSGLVLSENWTPYLGYADENTSGNKVTGTLTLTTNYGNGQSGTTTATCTLTIPENSSTKPYVSVYGTTFTDTNGYLNDYGKYLNNKSILKITPSANGMFGATISSYSYEIRKENATGVILDSGTGNTFSYPINYVGVIFIKITAKDTRNFTGSLTDTITSDAYNPPSSSQFNCERDANTPSTINCYIKASGDMISVSNPNYVNYKLYYKKTSTNTWTSYGQIGTGYDFNATNPPIKITGTDTASSYDIKLTAYDNITSETQIASDKVGSAFTLMNFNANGKAIGIGKVSEATGNNSLFEVAMNTNITGTLDVKDTLSINDSRIVLHKSIAGQELNGNGGTAGYMLIGTFKITSTYMNQPIILEIKQRSRFGNIYIQFSGGNTNDPSLSVFKTDGNISAYMYKSATSTWKLWVYKSESWDNIDARVKLGEYSNYITFTWGGTTDTSLPSGYVNASMYCPYDNMTTFPIRKVNYTTAISAGKIVITLSNVAMDTLVWLSFHSNNTNFGGSMLLNCAYGGVIINQNTHNTSGYSATISGYTSSGIVVTINNSDITASHTFAIKIYRTTNYNDV